MRGISVHICDLQVVMKVDWTSDFEPNFKQLLLAFHKVKDRPVEKLYSQGTYIAFHHLLIATLLAYYSSLSKLKTLSDDMTRNTDSPVEAKEDPQTI